MRPVIVFDTLGVRSYHSPVFRMPDLSYLRGYTVGSYRVQLGKTVGRKLKIKN